MKRAIVLAVVGFALSAPLSALANPRAPAHFKVTVDQAVLRRHQALGRLGITPPAPRSAQPGRSADGTRSFAWDAAAIGCGAGIALTVISVGLYRRANQRPAAA